jgi:hypothetical protein
MDRGPILTFLTAAILTSGACQSRSIVGLTTSDEASLRQALDIEMGAANARVPTPIEEQGKFLQIYRKQSDGSWKMTREIYNSDLPLPTPPPTPASGG